MKISNQQIDALINSYERKLRSKQEAKLKAKLKSPEILKEANRQIALYCQAEKLIKQTKNNQFKIQVPGYSNHKSMLLKNVINSLVDTNIVGLGRNEKELLKENIILASIDVTTLQELAKKLDWEIKI